MRLHVLRRAVQLLRNDQDRCGGLAQQLHVQAVAGVLQGVQRKARAELRLLPAEYTWGHVLHGRQGRDAGILAHDRRRALKGLPTAEHLTGADQKPTSMGESRSERTNGVPCRNSTTVCLLIDRSRLAKTGQRRMFIRKIGIDQPAVELGHQ